MHLQNNKMKQQSSSQKRVLVLGCTGSIGTSTLDIIRNEKNKYIACGLTANKAGDKLQQLAAEFNCPTSLTSVEGINGIKRLIEISKPDIVVNGIAGSAGLEPSMAVLDAGIDLALANKETVVMAGPLMFKKAEEKGCRILPVDSEHSAIFTLINQSGKQNIDQLIITASGGPFRNMTKEQLSTVTLKDALKHPTWNMGTKITVDSATLGNKGLEVIEAKRLFNMETKNISVVVHPQSIIHSLVRTTDGIVYAQLSEPDMKHPIIQALDWPEIKPNFMKKFDLTDTLTGSRQLTFEKPRYDDFPLLKLAFESADKDGCYPIAFNAANEIAAWSFIDEKISFLRIAQIVDSVLQNDWSNNVTSFKDVFEADAKARQIAKSLL